MTTPRGAAFEQWKVTKDGCTALDGHWVAFCAGYDAGRTAARLARAALVAEQQRLIDGLTPNPRGLGP